MKQQLLFDDDHQTYDRIIHKSCELIAEVMRYIHESEQRSLRVRIAIAKLSGMIDVLENRDDDLT